MSEELTVVAVTSIVKRRKEQLRERSTHMLVVVRDSKPCAVLSSADPSQLLRAAGVAGAGFGADALALVLEAVVPRVPENPLTGLPWARGEAEQVCREHDGAVKGWVAEALMVLVGFRDQRIAQQSWAYQVVDDSVVWDGPFGEVSAGGLADRVARTLADSTVLDPSRVPDPGDGFSGDQVNGPFYDPAYGRVVLDIGCTRVLSNQLGSDGNVALLASSVERADYLVSEGLPTWLVEIEN